MLGACSTDSEAKATTETALLQEGICAFSYPDRVETQTLSEIPDIPDISVDVLVDDTHVYWSTTKEGPTTLWRASKQSGTVETLLTTDGFYGPLQQGAYIYGWKSRALLEITKEGGTLRQVGMAPVYPLASNSAIDASAFYYIEGSSDCFGNPERILHSMRLDNGRDTAVGPIGCAVGVAVDDDSVYYTTNSQGGVYHLESRPKGGGSPTVLTDNVVHVRDDGIDPSFALAGNYLYFKYTTDPRGQRWQLARVAKTGGAPELLSDPNCFNMDKIAARGDHVMLNGNQGLAAFAADGTVEFYGSLAGTSEFNCALDTGGVYCAQDVDSGADTIEHRDF